MKNHTRGAPDESGQGAQSESVGLVIIFGIVFISISIILLLGLPVLEDARDKTQLERFKSEFGILNQQIRESIYAPGQSSASISLANGRISVDDGSNSMSINITYTPKGGTPVSTGEMPLGRLMFDGDGDTGVAYEGGGVWTASRNAVSLSSPPAISYTGNTLNMNLINFTNDTGLAGNTRGTLYFSSKGTHRSDELRSITNSSLKAGKLEISVKSEFERGWAEYFERALAANTGSVEINEGSPNDGRGFANVTLRTGPPLYSIENALNHSGDSSTDVNIDPSNVVNITDRRVDDVPLGNYTGTELNSNNGPPRGIEDLPNAAGLCHRSFDGEDLGSVSSPVTSGTYETNNPTVIGGKAFVTDGGDLRINAETDVKLPSGSTTKFDTSGGNVEVHVDGELNLNGDIEVNGTNSVRFYVRGKVKVEGSSSVDIEDGRTKRLQILGTEGAEIRGSASYNGTVYAQDDIVLNGNSDFVGAAVTSGKLDIGDNDYTHDTSTRGAAPDCASGPLRNLNAVERRVAVR